LTPYAIGYAAFSLSLMPQALSPRYALGLVFRLQAGCQPAAAISLPCPALIFFQRNVKKGLRHCHSWLALALADADFAFRYFAFHARLLQVLMIFFIQRTAPYSFH